MGFPVWRGALINVADPECEARSADGVREGQADFSIPGSGVGGSWSV
jgi:hypothetical protein